jgi:hypothetical protein
MSDQGWTLRIAEAELDDVPRDKIDELETALAGVPYEVVRHAGSFYRVVRGTGDPPAIVLELASDDAERARALIRQAVRASGSLYPELA